MINDLSEPLLSLANLFIFRFTNFVGLDNDIAGVEYIDAASQNSPWGGAMIKDSLIGIILLYC